MRRKCNKCKGYFLEAEFVKINYGGNGFFKTCKKCRSNSRDFSRKYYSESEHKTTKSINAKIHYEEHKEEILPKNKKYRSENKDKIATYERSEKRKTETSEWTKKKRKENPPRFLYYAAKRRAKLQNIEFSITEEDIREIYPEDNLCPILKISIAPNEGKMKDNSPSLDRIVPSKGYIKGNILVISYKANRIKNDATPEELEQVSNFMKEWFNNENIID